MRSRRYLPSSITSTLKVWLISLGVLIYVVAFTSRVCVPTSEELKRKWGIFVSAPCSSPSNIQRNVTPSLLLSFEGRIMSVRPSVMWYSVASNSYIRSRSSALTTSIVTLSLASPWGLEAVATMWYVPTSVASNSMLSTSVATSSSFIDQLISHSCSLLRTVAVMVCLKPTATVISSIRMSIAGVSGSVISMRNSSESLPASVVTVIVI